ncbi:MAG: Rnase Y domain-containing protein, partial [Thermodesulfobacteriota bacterium]
MSTLYVHQVLFLVLAFGFGCLGGVILSRMLSKKRLAQSREEARQLLARAEKEADALIKEARVQAKEALYQSKHEFERETKERRAELQKLENRLLQREEHLDKKVELLDQKEMNLDRREKMIAHQERVVTEKVRDLDRLVEEHRTRLESLAGITTEEAKTWLIQSIESDAKERAAKLLKRIEDETRAAADKKAKELIALAIQRCAADY